VQRGVREPTVIEKDGRLVLNKLSKSSATRAADCLFSFYLKYVLDIPRPTDYTMFIGVVGHEGLNKNNQTKIETDYYMNVDDLQLYTAEVFDQQLSFEDIAWVEDGEKISPGKEKDTLVRQVGDYRQRRSDLFLPQASEERFEIKFENAPWYVEGYIDVITRLAEQDKYDIIMDYKFSGSKFNKTAKQELLEMSYPAIEPSLYQLGARSRGIEPAGFQYERLVRNKKGFAHDSLAFSVPSSAERGALMWLRDVANMVQALLDALNGKPSVSNRGGFLPRISTYPGERWKCSRCEYADICKKELMKL